VPISGNLLEQHRRKPRLSDSRSSGQQYDLALASSGALPAAKEGLAFLLASDESRERRPAHCFKSAFDGSWLVLHPFQTLNEHAVANQKVIM
jgi:hypothetical protein